MSSRELQTAFEERVLIQVATSKDASITQRLLAAENVESIICKDIAELIDEVPKGAGVLLLTEDNILAKGFEDVAAELSKQPKWSDLPTVILMRGGVQSPRASDMIQKLTNVTILDRPTSTRSVVSAIKAGLRARKRQYQAREQLADLNEARALAERNNRMKDDFLATLSHELRTPLNAIVGWTEILKETPGDAPLVEQAVGVIDRNVQAQTQLIEDLLDVSRIVSGKVILSRRPTDLAAVIANAIETVRNGAAGKGIKLDVRILTGGTAVIDGDASRLQQVVWNLLTNSIKFTPKGGSIVVSLSGVESFYEISVVDSGAGLAAEFLPQLFDRFTQADSSPSRRFGGLGLGLSIVKTLVELHGGSVVASSEGKDRGTTIRVRLPMQNLQPDRSKSIGDESISQPTKIISLQGIHVLVVDDQEDSREAVGRLLQRAGAKTALAASASEANELLFHFSPQVIVSDIGMPEVDGYVFMSELRRRGVLTPAIALTAFARAEDRSLALASGFQLHMPKPLNSAALIAAVLKLCG